MAIFCKHEWKMIKDTCRMHNNGSIKVAKFKCAKCDKERPMDILDVPKNKYVFKEYSKGSISDGYHTFDELYHHRMILFSVICNGHKEHAWKSWKHHDDTMYDDYFLVGVDTPKGQYSYHYHKDNWKYFDVLELNNAPEWDGHKPEDIERLLSLK